MTKRLLHFTLGPVQGFVAQARRTRDLWAGSFLLSWLSGKAMRAVLDNGGKIIVPHVKEDALFKALSTGKGGFGPAVGSLPNRFKAEVPGGFEPKLCRDAIDDAWQQLANKVWERFVAPVAGKGIDTKVIWDRQIGGFWETSFVIGLPDGSDHTWLDRRKNWRSHRPPIEGGDHCMLMGDWRELSGFVRSRERAGQDAFWRELKTYVDQKSDNPLQLDENERLCAIALVKRLFPHVAGDLLGWEPSWDGGQKVRWPSTPRLAATAWLRYAWKEAHAESKAFVALAKDTKGQLIEPEVDVGDGPLNLLSKAPGHLLHESGVEYAHVDELGGVDREALRDAYEKLTKKAGEPSAFYALLLMDGDKVGRLLRRERGEELVTQGLARFSAQVDGIVRRCGGNTVYAGGDDVLALLPLEDALPAALELREAYRGAFAGDKEATISAAVILAHFHVPLRHVLQEAHHQLDVIAKNENGRDSVAVCVLTQSGVTRQWVSAWGAGLESPPAMLAEAAHDVVDKTSGRFFYAMREQYERVIKDGVLDKDDVRQILIAEYRRSEAAQGQKRDDIDRHMGRLFVLAERHTASEDCTRAKEAPLVSMDGPLMARFLAREARRT